MPKGHAPLKQRQRLLSDSRRELPEDIERHVDGDGSPCFACGVRRDVACRHRGAS